MEDKYFNKHVDKADLSSSIDIPKEEKEKFLEILANPRNFCERIQKEYEYGISKGEEPYVDDKGNCKFECIVNDSQIPGLPLPGTYQYDKKVSVLNKEDFE